MDLKRILAAVVVGGMCTLGVVRAGALEPRTCEALAGEDGQRRDTAIFDHGKGELVWPNPAKLVVRDGDVFVIVFLHTDSTHFDYGISPLTPDATKAGFAAKAGTDFVVTRRHDRVCLSWKFDKTFPLYQVSITRRVTDAAVGSSTPNEEKALEEERAAATDSEAQSYLSRVTSFSDFTTLMTDPEVPDSVKQSLRAAESRARQRLAELSREHLEDNKPRQLYPYVFPLWVQAADATVYFSSGFAFSRLTNDKFYVENASDGKHLLRRDRNASDGFRPDLMAYATLVNPETTSVKASWKSLWSSGRLGLSFGVGLGNDAEPRYFVGPSFFLGRQLALTAGVFGGQVDALPAGEKAGQPLANNGTTLPALGKRFKTGLGFGLSWTFGKGADKQSYIAALNGAQRVPEEAAKKPGAPTKLAFDADTCELSWEEPTDGGKATSYDVFVDEGKDPAASQKERTYKPSKVEKETTFKVVAKNAAGAGDPAEKKVDACTPKPADPAAAAAASTLSAPAIRKLTDDCVLLWSAPAEGTATAYEIFRNGKSVAASTTLAYLFTEEIARGDSIYVIAKNEEGKQVPSASYTATKKCPSK